MIVYVNFPRRRFFEVIHTAYERTFTRAARPDYNDFLALFDVQIDTFQNLKVAETLVNIFKPNHTNLSFYFNCYIS